MANVKVWCNNHAQYLEIISLLNRLDYTWADGVLLPNYDPFLDAAYDSDNFKCAICINRDNKSISVSLRDNDTISFEAFMQNKFTKADLEDNMIVKLRDGRCYMYFKETDQLIRYEGDVKRFSDAYNADLTFNRSSLAWGSFCAEGFNRTLEDNDIIAVYKVKLLDSLRFEQEIAHEDDGNVRLVWERPNEVVMTLAEVEAKLGIKHLKIVEE